MWGCDAFRLNFAEWCFEYPEREFHDWLLIFVMVMNFLVCIALMRVPGHGKKLFRVVVVYIGSISKGMGVRRLGKCPEKEIPMRG